MAWWREWGKYADKLPENAPALQKKPVLLPGLHYFYQAYQDLLTDRQVGNMGCMPISWSSIIRWAEYNGITEPEKVDRLMKFIRALEANEVKSKE